MHRNLEISNNFRIFAADFLCCHNWLGYAHREVGIFFFMPKDLQMSNNFRIFASSLFHSP